MNSLQLEKIIGYRFKNREYLERALTHSSFNREKNTKHKDNERLEFLGDAFLDAVISVELFRRMPEETEGKLTKTRALIVCEKSLANAARKIDLGRFMNMGHGEDSAGGRAKDSILADCTEAIIGALYLDGGYDEARRFVLSLMEDTICDAVSGKIFLDYKSVVQEVLQSGGVPVNIVYVIDREEGPSHDKTFIDHVVKNYGGFRLDVTMEVKRGCITGLVGRNGAGKSKKEAEQNAARQTLDTLKRGEIF